MEDILAVFSFLYPATLIILIILLAYYYNLSIKLKKSKFLNFLILLTIISYFISFFSNYDTELFLIVWFIRDMAVLILMFKLWKLFVKYKVIFVTVLSLLLIGLGYLYYERGDFSVFQKNKLLFEYDNSAELLFDIKNPKDLSKVKNLLKEYDPEILKAFPQVKDTAVTQLDDYYTVDIDNKELLSGLILELQSSGLVDWVEYNEVYTLSPIEQKTVDSTSSNVFSSNLLNDPYISKLWGFNYMDIDDFNVLLEKKKPVYRAKIFILDTGVDSEHEDLKDNYVSLNEKYNKDTDIHGTHCAGIACAVSNNNIGIASLNLTGKYTSITSITVLPGGRGSQESIIDGIIIAADNGADVISMSLGGKLIESKQRAYNEAIKYANNKGVIIVVAAGNENDNAKNHVPASCKGVITVSAVDENLSKAEFSNYVTDIEFKVAAPGVNIYSTVPANDYKSLNGTSMATPYVAGLVGVMKSINPDITTEEVYQILKSSGIDTKNTDATGKFIQPLKAISNLKSTGIKSHFIRFLNKTIIVKPKRKE